jgi:hypothetical protein
VQRGTKELSLVVLHLVTGRWKDVKVRTGLLSELQMKD